MAELKVVATPIGNLGDIGARAMQALQEAKLIIAEDTRVTKKLLQAFEIPSPRMLSLDIAVKTRKWDFLVDAIKEAGNAVLVTDAGTPGISDPGARLIRAVRKDAHIHVQAIPGPAAATTLLSIAGVPAASWTFIGFLPLKKGRQTEVKKLLHAEHPVIIYEAPHRLLKLLSELEMTFGTTAHHIVIGRELTKMHESIYEGTAATLNEYFKSHEDEIRGEISLLVIGPGCGHLIDEMSS